MIFKHVCARFVWNIFTVLWYWILTSLWLFFSSQFCTIRDRRVWESRLQRTMTRRSNPGIGSVFKYIKFHYMQLHLSQAIAIEKFHVLIRKITNIAELFRGSITFAILKWIFILHYLAVRGDIDLIHYIPSKRWLCIIGCCIPITNILMSTKQAFYFPTGKIHMLIP